MITFDKHDKEELEQREYDARDDFNRSLDEAYAAIRERIKAGGPGWEPKAVDQGSRIGYFVRGFHNHEKG